ncbi:hypothetical protein DFW101_3360 [Solidesulfovibrio carbinoliphilus subsp. oakridgensis]|uniref:Uncharacterized protein n=1 Tax=Solidesulfovibrio carbinoliphilus subsp. oakridgensis TaxID=694327 RepID=G7QBD5_9BACT|nr:DUF6599 family protein [Solidesulfovibrio carbinoliphilus]EHJ49358.1 hypothetical protein DFW101_3360 [Solidesulfovibrio carbinoliphilus subsp. oakridgensis]
MGPKRSRIGRGERTAAWTVLALLVAAAVWIGLAQSRLSPAVAVALAPPRPVGTVAGAAGGRVLATAGYLGDLPGAVPATPVASYDPDTLSDRIDGKAELYLAAGFKEMSTRAYRLAGGARVDAWIYAQTSPSGAFAVLSGQRRAGARPSPLSPDAYATENAVYFTKGNLYVELVADRDDAATGQGLAALGAALAAALPGDGPAVAGHPGPVDEKTLFPKDGLDLQSIRLAASDAMGLAGFSNVYTAEYALPQGAATAFLARRATPAEAARDAKTFAGFIAQNGYVPETAPGLPDGATLLVADGSYEIVWAKGTLVAGVHDAVSREAALALATRLAASLPDFKDVK